MIMVIGLRKVGRLVRLYQKKGHTTAYLSIDPNDIVLAFFLVCRVRGWFATHYRRRCVSKFLDVEFNGTGFAQPVANIQPVIEAC